MALFFSKREAQAEYDALMARPHKNRRIGKFLEAFDDDIRISVATDADTLPATFVQALASSDCVHVVDEVTGRRWRI